MPRRILTAVAFVAVMVASAAAFGANVTRDANGWTDVAPSGDSTIIYVSATGSDSNNGLSTGLPKLTLAAATAAAFAVDVKPSHVRIKCGDVFTNQGLGSYHNLNGRGSDEPIVIESWDFSQNVRKCSTRPQLVTNGSSIGSFLSRGGSGTTTHVYILGIDFYDKAKDPAFGGSTTAPNTTAIQFFDGGDDVLIEDCSFRFLFNGMIFQYVSGPSPQNLTIRRNLFLDHYNGGSNSGHSQGFYGEGWVGTNLVEENFFDHNGWNDAGGQSADVFNHHTYIADSQGITYRRNTLLTDSSLSTKFVYYGNEPGAVPALANISITDNFYWEGEVGVSMAADSGASCYATTGCITGATISNNVLNQVDKSPPTGRAGVGWGIEIKDIISSAISNNICTDFSYNSGQFCIGMDDDLTTAVSGSDTISGNLAYKIGNASLYFQPTSHWSSVAVTGNTIQDPSLGAYMVQATGSFPYTGLVYSGGIYSPTSTSHFADVGGTKTYAQWLSGSSETGSSINTVSYPAPTRNLDSYAASIGATNAAGFETAIRTLSRYNWDVKYTATCINDYIRAGFGVASLGACTSSSNPSPGVFANRPIAYIGWFVLLLAIGSALGAASAGRRKAIAAERPQEHLIDEETHLALEEMRSEGLGSGLDELKRGDTLVIQRKRGKT
jgi:hypothetical protein